MSTIPITSSGQSRTTPMAETATSPNSLSDILQYISAGWDILTRTMNRCDSLEDTKTGGEAVLYLPAGMGIPAAISELQMHCRVRVEHLPTKITVPGEIDPNKIPTEGLLYLANPYVVPGGQFNEMYGWDSYFIIRGLLREHRTELARGMVENFFFEIDHYGGVLNANRTYYLTRSQPPFLSSMILAVYDAEKAEGKTDLPWLEKAYRYALRDYEQWNQKPHLAGNTGLSRYFDHGEGPVPEIVGDPSHYYRGVVYFFLAHDFSFKSFLVHDGASTSGGPILGPKFPVFVCDPETGDIGASDCAPASYVALSADFYKGDRSMRESGFDVSFRFGPFGAATHHFAPVCLNSLLYKTETDMERMSTLLGHPEDAKNWKSKAAERRQRMNQYFWDASRGLFFDYNVVTAKRSKYEYATTFYPLWAGLASKEEARAIVHNLNLFEQPGGLAMSRTESQAQWDLPYGWAPIQLLAVEGLRRYGYNREADRISGNFLSMVLENFRRDHTIREKYNVVTRSSETSVVEGYAQNVTGFGWTNAVFLELLHESPDMMSHLGKDQ
ncbi:MAG: trehalase family glycosidase [Terriglobales bacterium]